MKCYKLLGLALSLILLPSVLGQSCETPEPERIDCDPWEGGTEARCLSRGCLWCPALMEGAPSCHLPSNYGYQVLNSQELPGGAGYLLNLTRTTDISYVGNDAQFITALFDFQSDARLRIKITDGTNRFEVPLDINPPPAGPTNPLYSLEFQENPFSFKVVRKSSGVAVFDTSMGGLTFADQFIQLSIKLPSRNAYGIGENEQKTYRQDFSKWQTFGIWTRDNSPENNTNIYGAHPYYTVVEDDGNSHSVLMLNSNAQEFVLSPAPAYTYRTIGGLLDVYVFLGPTPEDTNRQFTQAVGRSPLPPYWGLGFNLCRWGYNNVANMRAAVDRLRNAGIPQDVQFGDLDVLDNWLTLTYDKQNFDGLPEYIREIKETGIKFIITVNPGIAYNTTLVEYEPLEVGNDLDVWCRRPDGTPAVGEVWPGATRFIDYSRPVAKVFWRYMLTKYKETIDWDGVWLDMNEPASWADGDQERGCADNNINNPPYTPRGIKAYLSNLTMCPDVIQNYGIHYNTHNLYGWQQAKATFEATRTILGPSKRTIALSRSTFTGAGRWVTHWLGDNFSTWANMAASLIGVMQFNIFGIPHVGPDICGFYGTPTEELCTRWLQVGAFFPYSRNHNVRNAPDQDPGVWSELSRNSTRDALMIRYTLLPYLYQLFYLHRTQGDTVARALWHEFPTDTVALGVDKQFLWGSAFLITPVLEEGATTVTGHFPAARWYSYYTGLEVSGGGSLTLDAPFEFIPLHIRGGYILPTQEPALNTQLSRVNPFGLIVALDESRAAAGGVYWDDGNTFEAQEVGVYFSSDVTFSDGVLTQTVTHDGYPEMAQRRLGSLRILGVSTLISSVLVNGAPHTDFEVTASNEVKVNNLNVVMNTDFVITFR